MLLDYLIFRGWVQKGLMVRTCFCNSHSSSWCPLFAYCTLKPTWIYMRYSSFLVGATFSCLKNTRFAEWSGNSARTVPMEPWAALGLTPSSSGILWHGDKLLWYLGLAKEQAHRRHLKFDGVNFPNRAFQSPVFHRVPPSLGSSVCQENFTEKIKHWHMFKWV